MNDEPKHHTTQGPCDQIIDELERCRSEREAAIEGLDDPLFQRLLYGHATEIAKLKDEHDSLRAQIKHLRGHMERLIDVGIEMRREIININTDDEDCPLIYVWDAVVKSAQP